ncbi:EAL domain-containing protein [Nitratifractor sp.]
MLRSLLEERSRHFSWALRIALPLLVFVGTLAYGVFFRETPIDLSTENVILGLGIVFVFVYFVFFSLELSRKETLLDQVTEGYTYEVFLERIRRECPATLAALQIGNLAEINEHHGVQKTDRILKHLVEILDKEVLSENGGEGYVGRKMGAEILLASSLPPERFQKEVEGFVARHPQIDGVDVSLNYAVIDNGNDDPEKALNQLRDLLVSQESVHPGPSRKVVDARELSREEETVLSLLKEEALSLSVRPLLNLKNGRKDLYEIGVSMRKSNGQWIPPKNFLPIINRHDMGTLYDRIIFRKVLELASLVDEDISFSFNLSPYSLRNETFMQEILEMLERSGVAPRRLIVELYERRQYHSMEKYFERLRILKRHGVRLCLDNFGASNASMEYLRHFPFDMIQLDRSFTQELKEEKGRSIVRSFVTLAHEMQMLIAVKWIDDLAVLKTAKSLGVDYAQGYAVGKVRAGEDLIRQYNPIKKGE